MVMKDKLVKFGHKKGYYLAKETFKIFLACVCLFSIVAIPTYIASNTEANRSSEKVENDDENKPVVESIIDHK